jgi:hypothetical protein
MASGINHFKGAEWVLRYLRSENLWDDLLRLEISQAGGIRRYDANVGGIMVEFKSWRSFNNHTFIRQILRDDRLGNVGGYRLKWVFDGRQGIGTQADVIRSARQALDNYYYNPRLRALWGIDHASYTRIYNELPRIIDVG